MAVKVTKKFHRYAVMVTDLYLDEANQPRADERMETVTTARDVSEADIAKRYPNSAKVEVIGHSLVKATMPAEQFLTVAHVEEIESDDGEE